MACMYACGFVASCLCQEGCDCQMICRSKARLHDCQLVLGPFMLVMLSCLSYVAGQACASLHHLRGPHCCVAQYGIECISGASCMVRSGRGRLSLSAHTGVRKGATVCFADQHCHHRQSQLFCTVVHVPRPTSSGHCCGNVCCPAQCRARSEPWG